MSSILESLAMGLRGAGGLMSPEVYKQNAQDDRQQAQLRQQLQLQQYQQRIKDEREKALAQAVAPHLASGNFDQAAAAAASTPGGFQTGMTLMGQSEQRKARIEQAKMQLDQRAEELKSRHEQALELARQRGADQRTLAEMNNKFRAEQAEAQRQSQQLLLRLGASLRPERQSPIVQTSEGIFERTPQGLVPLKTPDGQIARPPKSGGDKPMTEFQGKNFLFGSRAAESDNILSDLEDKISTTGLAVKQAAANTPLIGGVLGAVGNVALSKEQQQVEQAQRNFVNAVLRQESGAVISEQEFENAKKQYFPQPGDSQKVIEQKRANRETAINGFQKIAGPGGEDIAAIRAKKKKKSDGADKTAPAGVDPKVWAVMTPEERKLWN